MHRTIPAMNETPTQQGAHDVDAESAPRLLQELVHRAEDAGASDIHIHLDGSIARVAFRLDGLLTAVQQLPSRSLPRRTLTA